MSNSNSNSYNGNTNYSSSGSYNNNTTYSDRYKSTYNNSTYNNSNYNSGYSNNTQRTNYTPTQNTTYRSAYTTNYSSPTSSSNTHLVRKGDTIYSIAFRHNLDFRSLAAANGIGSDYSIYPGQRLTLDNIPTKRPWRRYNSAPSYNTQPQQPYTPPQQQYNPAPSYSPPRPIYTRVNTPAPTPAYTIASLDSSKNRTQPSFEQTNWYVDEDPQFWTWPSNGQLVTDFKGSSSLHKGIDLRGNLGEPVRAAAAGKVVYAGDGLRNYGNLVIVKHSDNFLSAYAHNRRILVSEGVTVGQGQRIAEMGSSGTDSVKLHFQIRYDGNPVDPLNYLPRK